MAQVDLGTKRSVRIIVVGDREIGDQQQRRREVGGTMRNTGSQQDGQRISEAIRIAAVDRSEIGDGCTDRHAFNEFLLKAQRVVPLSNFAITNAGGEDVYELMGELSCKTTLQTILIELRTLAENAIDATELRETFGADAA